MAAQESFAQRMRETAMRVLRDPKKASRLALGLLVAANLVAGAAVLRPWGGSEEELQRQRTRLLQDLKNLRASTEQLRGVVENVEKTRQQAGEFIEKYFLDRQTAYSTVLSELNALAEKAGIRPGDHVYTFDPVEGSDDLAMMTVSGNYQGSYGDLLEFVNAIDRSPRFITIERLQAQPAQNPGVLAIGLRLNVFVRGEAQPQ